MPRPKSAAVVVENSIRRPRLRRRSRDRARAQLLWDGFVCGPRFPLSSLKDASGEVYSATA